MSVDFTPSITDLIDPEHLSYLLHKLACVTGAAASIIDNQGNPLSNQDADCDLCSRFHRNLGKETCRKFYKEFCQRAAHSGRMVQDTCPFDLAVGLAPILVKDRALAYIRCGQVFPEFPNLSRICHLADLLQVEVEPYRQALLQQKVMSSKDFTSVMDLGWAIAQSISREAQQALGQRQLEALLHRGAGGPDPGAENPDHHHRRLLESAPLVAYSLDADLATLFISPYCRTVFGYTDEEISRDRLFWDRHIHPDDREWVRRERESCLKACRTFTIEYRAIRQDGSTRHIINHSIPKMHNRQLHRIDGFIFDITARKYSEEQSLLAEKIKLLNDMSLSVAHEIRNPLTSIGGFARLLHRRMSENDPNRAHLEIILKEVGRLEQTLNLALGNLKTLQLNLQPGDMNQLLAAILNQLERKIQQQGIQLSANFGSGIPEVSMDHQLMEQVIRSLLQSIIPKINAGGELAVTSSHRQHDVIIEMTGDGLDSRPPRDNQLFFPFYRRPVFDNGLELPLSQQIISEHGGNLIFRGGYHNSASLVISLPAHKRPKSTT